MAFAENPLSLSVSPEAFEAWLRDNGYLEVLDRSTIDPARTGIAGIVSSVLGFIFNPFGSLTVQDLFKEAVPWTGQFWDCGHGLSESYGWPLSGTQLKLRMAENAKRYLGNYLRLFFIIVACFIYKMPISFVGIVLVFFLWDAIRRLSKYFNLQRVGYTHQALLLFGKLGTGVVMIYCKVALAICWAGILSFAVVIVHSSLRKITPSKGHSKLASRH